MSDDPVVIHTDGGCRPNPGPGGWGAVLRQGRHVREMCGGEAGSTSNNRMELTAPIMALEALTRPVTVHLYTDSTYVRNGITKWVQGWERNGWKPPRSRSKTLICGSGCKPPAPDTTSNGIG